MLHPFRLSGRLLRVLIPGTVLAFTSATTHAAVTPVTVLLQINRIAGSPNGVSGEFANSGPATLSLLNQPEGVAVDGGGDLYVADTANNQIERIDHATGNISTVAANGLLGSSGTTLLSQPASVLVDAHGNLYIADSGNHLVRHISMDTGIVTTVAGNPAITLFEPGNIGDGGLATAAALENPVAMALDQDGNLYVADANDNRVREIFARTGIISTVAGTGTAGYRGDNGPAIQAELNQPSGVAVDLAGNLYISDSGNNLIREVNRTSRIITTVAGVVGASGGYNGDGEVATQALLNYPTGIAVDFSGQIYFSDRDNSRIRKISADGSITTLAGSGTAGFIGDGSLASSAELHAPIGIALDHEGNLFVADSGNNVVRVISQGIDFPAAAIHSDSPPSHTIFLRLNTAAAVSTPSFSTAESPPDSSTTAPLQEYSAGNITGCIADGSTLNVGGSICSVPLRFTPQYPGLRTGVMHFFADGASISLGLYGVGLGPQALIAPGTIGTCLDSASVSRGVAITAPQRIAIDPAGNLYVADSAANVVWSFQTIAGSTPTIVAGGGLLSPAKANGGAATDAALQQPSGVALDAAGNLYIAEAGANLVRMVNLTTGIISTVAGTGTAGYSGDSGVATSATLNAPVGIAVNPVGDLFIADTNNNVIRRVYRRGGIIVTVAGTGVAGYAGDGGDSVQARLNHPQGVALDVTGQLYVADTGNNVVRTIDPVTGSISTIAGNGTAGFSGDGGLAIHAQLHSPSDLAIDAAGDLYIADASNARVSKVSRMTRTVSTLAGSQAVGDGGDGGPANAAALTTPTGIASDSIGQLWVSDPGNHTVRRISSIAPTLNFGTIPVGSVTAEQTDSLFNIGNQGLEIDAYPALPLPPDYVLTPAGNPCVVGNLLPGDHCDISFAFHPTAAGQRTEDVWILDNALNVTGARQAVAMTGNGITTAVAATATAVTVDPSIAVYGNPIQATARVTDGTGTVTMGTVTFAVNGTHIAAVPMPGSGAAHTQLPVVPTGLNLVTGTYTPVGNELGSTGEAPLTVTPATTRTTLATSASNLDVGESVTITATVVSSTTGVPTGNVTFMDGTAQLGTGRLKPNGQASLITTQLTPGPNTLTATYSGDGNFQASQADSVTIAVTDTMLTLTIRPATLNIAAGKTGATSLLLTPVSDFSDKVHLACGGLVRGATCQFSSSDVTFSSGSTIPQSVTLVINPHMLSVAGIYMPAKTISIVRIGLLLLGLGAMLLPFVSRRRAASFGWGRILLVLICVGLGSLLGCANLAPPPVIVDDVTVQATTGTLGVVASAQLQVNMAQ